MPTYQFACTNPDCGNQFELVQSFTDPAASECPVCAGPVRKVFSAVGVVFKGSGFYRTDSRSGGKPGDSSTSSPAPKSDSSAPKSDSSTSSGTSSNGSTSSSPASSSTSSSSTTSTAASA